MSTCNWAGYTFNVYNPSTTTWHDVSGIYIFAGLDRQQRWVAVYIGQATSFANRIPNHERGTEAGQLGATHIHAIVVPKGTDRDIIEAMLIRMYQPPLNAHHK